MKIGPKLMCRRVRPKFARIAAALVITAEFDPLRDEGEANAMRLCEAAVSVNLQRYDRMIHGFFGMSTVLDQGKKTIGQIAATLRRSFNMK